MSRTVIIELDGTVTEVHNLPEDTLFEVIDWSEFFPEFYEPGDCMNYWESLSPECHDIIREQYPSAYLNIQSKIKEDASEIDEREEN